MKRIILTTVLAGLLGSLVYAQNNSDNSRATSLIFWTKVGDGWKKK